VDAAAAGPPGAEPVGGASGEVLDHLTPGRITVTPLAGSDWPAAARIYAAGIAGGDATFESHAPSWEEFSRGRAGCPAVLARGPQGDVLGWAALSPASARGVYWGVGAVSIYVDPAFARQGVGGVLLGALIEASEGAGFWTLEAGIFPENTASIVLHKGFGFELVGVRRRIGQMPDGRWRDVRLYERRSPSVGRD
jgi:L-amino acid N-acyltransferase YncA